MIHKAVMRQYVNKTDLAFVALFCCCLCSMDAVAADRVEWLPNLDTAKQAAMANGKDLFIVFTGSNWCGHCMTLDREDLNTDEFASVASGFVLVRLDYRADADNKVPERLPEEQPAPHTTWKEDYDIPGFPTVYLADPSGRPYAMTGDMSLDAKHFAEHVRDLKKTHAIRDTAFAKAKKVDGIERAKAIATGLDALEKAFADKKEGWESSNAKHVAKWYREQIDAVIRFDADNNVGLHDRFTDLLDRAALRNEDDAFYDKLRKLGRDKKNLDEALRLLDKRIAESKSVAIRNRARHARLINLEWADRNQEALAYARELAADKSFSSEDRRFFRERLPYNLHRLKRDDEALAIYDELISEAKDNPHRMADYLTEEVAVILFPAKRFAKAFDCCEQAIKLEPPDTLEWEGIQWWRVRVLTELGRTDEACAASKSLVESKNMAAEDRAWGLATLADLLEKRGLHDDAMSAKGRARQILDRDGESLDAATASRIKEHLSKDH